MIMKKILLLLIILLSAAACASKFTKVDEDLSRYDKTVQEMKSEMAKLEPDPRDKSWVKAKLESMFQIDQYMRAFWNTPYQNQYNEEEKEFFNKQFGPRFESVDVGNTAEIKKLLTIYEWFKISEFGEKADNQAWLLVQHADYDHEFQKSVLRILEKLYPIKETKPINYAYLYDRVAASYQNAEKRILQRYGTQGSCVGPGRWEPNPIEDPANLDKRRLAMGMPKMSEYMEAFKDIFH